MNTFATIVVPVYQNAKNLEATIPCLLTLQESLSDYSLEFIFVDDGSTDASLQIISRFARENPGVVKGLKLARNFGQSAAIAAGLAASRGQWVVIISADLQEPYQAIPLMVQSWENGSRFVIGERVHRPEGLAHRALSGIYWWLIRKFAFSNFPRKGFDFCLIDKKIVTYINGAAEKNTSIFALIYWLGFEPSSVPIDRLARLHGESQWTFKKKLGVTIDTLIGFSSLPARFITLCSFATMTGLLIYGGFIYAVWLSSSEPPPGWMTLVGLILILGSMILFALGIISEYLLRILDASRRRPLVVEEETIDFLGDGE